MRAGRRSRLGNCGALTSCGFGCVSGYLPQLSLTERERIHEGLSDDRQAAVQIWGLLHVEHELGVLDDVDPEAEGQTVPKQRKGILGFK